MRHMDANAMQDAWNVDSFFTKRAKTPFVMAMPDEFKRDDGKEVQAYREYYRSKVFKNGKKPAWEKGAPMPHWYAQANMETQERQAALAERMRHWNRVLDWGQWEEDFDEMQTDATPEATE